MRVSTPWGRANVVFIPTQTLTDFSELTFDLSVAPHDTYGLLFAVASGNGDALRWTTRDVWSFRRYNIRWKSMCPIPGNIVSVGVMHIA